MFLMKIEDGIYINPKKIIAIYKCRDGISRIHLTGGKEIVTSMEFGALGDLIEKWQIREIPPEPPEAA